MRLVRDRALTQLCVTKLVATNTTVEMRLARDRALTQDSG